MHAWFYPAILSACNSLIFSVVLWSLYRRSISNHKYLAYLGTFEIVDTLAAVTMVGLSLKGLETHKTSLIFMAVWDTASPLLVLAAAFNFKNQYLHSHYIWALVLARVALVSGLVVDRPILVALGTLPSLAVYGFMAHTFCASGYWTPRSLRVVYGLSLLIWIVVDGPWGLPYANSVTRSLAALARVLQAVAVVNVHGRRLQIERDEAVQEYRELWHAYRMALRVVTLDRQASANGMLDELAHD